MVVEALHEQVWAPGLGTVLIPAARGRLRLAQGQAAEALADFEACAAMYSPEVWGVEIRDTGSACPLGRGAGAAGAR